MVRMFGLPESGLADTLRDAEQSIDGFDRLEITTCLRRGEVEMVTRYEPDAASTYTKLMELLRERHGREIFSEDGSLVDDQVGAAAWQAADRDGRILHRRAAGRPADRAAGFVGLTSPAVSSPTRTRRRPSCSASGPTCSRRTGRCPSPSPMRWPTAH